MYINRIILIILCLNYLVKINQLLIFIFISGLSLIILLHFFLFIIIPFKFIKFQYSHFKYS